MLVRIILFVILFFISYTVVSALMRVLGRVSSEPDNKTRVEENRMVECCQCGTYVPESDIIRRRVNAEDKEFCSRECMQEYKKENAE